MSLTIVICSVFFSIFSTSVLTYISMATPIGPWMGPTLALCGIVIARCIPRCTTEKLVYAVAAGSLGGIMATAFGFSFPTLYFLQKSFFDTWVAQPYLFIPAVASLACAAGLLGLWVASLIRHTLLEKQKMAFPVGVLSYNIIQASDSQGGIVQLLVGFCTTFTYCMLQATHWFQTHILPVVVTLLPATRIGWFSLPAVSCTMSIMPMLWSIGYIAGSMITIPLLVGTLSKIAVLDLVQHWYFPSLSNYDFVFAFCSGMVVVGAISSLLTMPKQLFTFIKKACKKDESVSTTNTVLYAAVPVIGIAGSMFWYFGFSVLSWIYVTIFSVICAYQIAVFAGRVGLAPLGRFATFVMVPGMLLFGLDAVQVTVLATFVEACGGVTTDALFGKKAGMLAGLDQATLTRYQIMGIIVSSITVAVVFWLLVTHFQLGSETLFAERAQGRALLVNAASFYYYVLLCGAFYGLILKQLGFNPMLVLGGLLMPLSLTLGLVFGGLSSSIIGKEKEYEPLCSGMFAANSLCMIIQALL